MPKQKTCPCHPIIIPEDRKVVFTDDKVYPWKMDSHGYFLVKIEKGLLCCGFVTPKHTMILELRGKDPHKLVKEIAKRKLCNLDNMAYISQELMIANDCRRHKKKYVQR
jgi:hypothetical protein